MSISFRNSIDKFQIVSFVFALLYILPIFLLDVCPDGTNSILIPAKKLNFHGNVKTAQLFNLLPAIFMILDFFFEWLTDRIRSPVICRERILISISLIIPNVLSLILTSATDLCYIYQTMENVGLILFYSAVASIVAKATNNSKLLLVIITLYFSSLLFQMFEELFPWMMISPVIPLALQYFSLGLLSIFLILWFGHFKKVWSRREHDTNPEILIPPIYVTVLLLHALSLSMGSFAYRAHQWSEYTEEYAVFILFVNAFFMTFLIIIPGRLSQVYSMKHQHLLSMKRTFVRYVSHEIRSPISALHSGLELLLKNLPEQTVTADFTELIHGILPSSQAAIDMLNDLLFYENIDAGAFALDIEKLRVVELFKDKLASLRMLTRSYDLELEIIDQANATGGGYLQDISTLKLNFLENSHLQLDISKIFSQVIRNLVTNACKFTKSRGKITIKFGVSPDASMFAKSPSSTGKIIGNFRVDVIDTGVGIARENFGKIFGEFSQVDKSSLQGGGGSGLGLWICRQVVELHGGLIAFTSEGEGYGSCFYFRLPIFATVDGTDNVLNESITRTALRVSEVAALESTAAWISGNNNSSPTSVSFTNGYQKLSSIFPSPSQSTPPIAALDGYMEFEMGAIGLVPTHAIDIHVPTTSFSFLSSQNTTNNIIPYVDLEFNTNKLFEPHTPQHSVIIPPRMDNCNYSTRLEIVIVDDSSINRKFLRKLFETEKSLNVNITEFYDGQDLVDMFTNNTDKTISIDCIFLDNFMLKLNGPETSFLLRNNYGFKGAIIGITGNALAADVEHFKICGANDVLLKPVSLASLLQQLRKAHLIA